MLLVCFATAASGQEPSAGDAAHFLRSGIGARALGMGRAFTALADGALASYWNPAGLVQTQSLHLEGVYENRYAGLVELHYLGGSWASSSWAVGLLLGQSDPYTVGFLSGAIRLAGITLGASARLYYFPVSGQPASGVGADFGVLWRLGLGKAEMRLAAVTSDVGWTRIHWEAPGNPANDVAAWVLRLGAAIVSLMKDGEWRAALDLESALRRPPRPGESDYLATVLEVSGHIGAEYWLNWIGLRAGLSGIALLGGGANPLPQPSLGLGVRLVGVEVNAGWSSGGLGPVYVLSAEFSF